MEGERKLENNKFQLAPNTCRRQLKFDCFQIEYDWSATRAELLHIILFKNLKYLDRTNIFIAVINKYLICN